MAKKKASDRDNNTVKKKPLKPIDNIPKCSQQRRSSPPKRRTDFSLFFFRNSSSSSDSDSLLESSCVEIALVNKTSNNLHDGSTEGEELFRSSLVRCSRKSPDEGSGLSSDSSAASFLEVGLVHTNARSEFDDDREVINLGNEPLGVLDYAPKKSYVAESRTPCVSPTSISSAKTCEIWLPGSELREISSAGLVENNPAASNNSDDHDLSPDKSTMSVASRIDDDSAERGRGKRERKPKVHFDDINIAMPMKFDTRVRRLRIMRYLGLTPPIGSPF